MIDQHPAILLAVVLLLLPTGLSAQKPVPESSAPHGHQVQLLVSVHDKKGPVAGLGPADVTLAEDGRTQSVQSFTRDTDLPFRIGLLVDTGNGLANSLEAERKAVGKFVHLLFPDNATAETAPQRTHKAFLIHFDRQVELLEDFTSQSTKLQHEVDDMAPSRPSRNERREGTSRDDDSGYGGPGDDNQRDTGRNGDRGGMGGRGRNTAASGTTLYDAIFLASDELMKSAKGRKALIVFSDGIDQVSKETLNDAIDAADSAGVEIFTIYLKGEEPSQGRGFGLPGSGGGRGGMGGGWPGSGGGGWPGSGRGSGSPGGGNGRGDAVKVDGRKILEKIATRTGGRFYEAKKKENLEEIYTQILEELKSQYLLTYTPDKAPDGEYHKVQVKTKKDDWTATAREGYYAAEK